MFPRIKSPLFCVRLLPDNAWRCRAEFAVGEVAIRGNINNVNGAIMMSVAPKANNSKDITRIT